MNFPARFSFVCASPEPRAAKMPLFGKSKDKSKASKEEKEDKKSPKVPTVEDKYIMKDVLGT